MEHDLDELVSVLKLREYGLEMEQPRGSWSLEFSSAEVSDHPTRAAPAPHNFESVIQPPPLTSSHLPSVTTRVGPVKLVPSTLHACADARQKKPDPDQHAETPRMHASTSIFSAVPSPLAQAAGLQALS